MTDTLAFKLAWRLLAYSGLVAAAAGFVFFWIYAHPKRFVSSVRPGVRHEAVKLTTSDGVELDGWFLPHASSKAAVIICHGYPMDKGDVLAMTSFLGRDFNLLYFDFRATGRSKGFFSTGGAREKRDIDAAVKYLETRGLGGGIGLYGFSMGAAAALLSANPSVRARALDSPYATLAGEMDHIFREFGALRKPLLAVMKLWSLVLMGVNIDAVSPAAAAAELKTPLFIAHGDADTQVPVASAYRIREAKPDTELLIVKGAEHGGAAELAGGEYEKRITAFFREHLRP